MSLVWQFLLNALLASLRQNPIVPVQSSCFPKVPNKPVLSVQRPLYARGLLALAISAEIIGTTGLLLANLRQITIIWVHSK